MTLPTLFLSVGLSRMCMCARVCVWGSKCSPWSGPGLGGPYVPDGAAAGAGERWRLDEAAGVVRVCVNAECIRVHGSA